LVEAIKRRTLSGGGIAWLPHSSVKAELASGELAITNSLDDTGKQLWESFG